ncbi:MAG TPA: energy transducer TonB [Pseudobdellovibrionaceae bacterium]|nr:energy transducer TonB [Pseudobdellovibrionaceae bacterium]
MRFALGLSFGLHLAVGLALWQHADREPNASDLWRGSIEIEIVDLGAAAHESASPQVKRLVREIQRELADPETVAAQASASKTSEAFESNANTTTTTTAPAATSLATGSGGEGGTLSPQEATAAEIYVRELRRQLERRKSYPLAAKRMGHQGRVVVRFILERSGQVKSAQIVQASSSKFLNDAAEDLIRRLDGLEPFPVQLSKSEWAFQVPIDYHM